MQPDIQAYQVPEMRRIKHIFSLASVVPAWAVSRKSF